MILQPLAWLRSYWVSPRAVRAEAWALGGRHMGDVEAGAKLEAAAMGVTSERSILLHAVLRDAGARRRKRGRS